jgi:hypothetical protein
MKKVIGSILLYLLAFAIIVAGVFCGIQLYKEVKAESYINGSIDISNRFSQESFNYSSTSVVFYHDLYDDTDTYSFEKDLLKVDDFDGKKNTYQVVLNDYVLLNTEINSGSVFSVVAMDFYDTSGNIVDSTTMNVSVKFLSNKTQLTLATTGKDSASFLEQYFSDNGIRLQINQIL